MDDRRFCDAVGFVLANLQKPSLELSVYQKEASKNNTHRKRHVRLPSIPQFATIICPSQVELLQVLVVLPKTGGGELCSHAVPTYSKSIMAVSKRIALKFGVEVSTLFVLATPSWLLSFLSFLAPKVPKLTGSLHYKIRVGLQRFITNTTKTAILLHFNFCLHQPP